MLRSGRRVHLIETGDGPPVVFLHGSNTSSLSLLPVLARLEGVHAIAVDRPGFGLSEPVRVPRQRFRDAAVEFLDDVARRTGAPNVRLRRQLDGWNVGLWYALAHPERVRRLVLLGSVPLLPGTRLPIPLRVTAAPLLGDLLPHVVKPNRKLLVRLMASMGEKDTIVRYPELIESIVAAAGTRSPRPRTSPSSGRSSLPSDSGRRRGWTRMNCVGSMSRRC